MRVFDLHCDTITELEKIKGSLFENELHISLKKALCLERYIQVFAIFIPDEKRGNQAVEYFDLVCDFYEKQLADNKSTISSHLDKSENKNINALKLENSDNNKITSILSVEGGAAANGTIEGLRHLYNRGVRLITLTWNGDNEIASGAWTQEDNGLTAFGEKAVREMEKLSIIVDVSHLSKKGFFDVAKIASKPFIASHSNCDIVKNIYAQKRNLSDEQIRILVFFGGLMGINLCSDFLGDKEDCETEAVYRHISHALDLGAEKILALGCDFDGCQPVLKLRGIDKMPPLFDALLYKGIPKSTLEDIFFNNANTFFEKYCKSVY